jgi:hypothetical protein
LICAPRSVRWPAVASGLVCLAGCSSATRDVVPSSSDVVVDGGGASQSREGYEYIARRPLGAVALAEARGIDAALARTAVDRLADALNRCATTRIQDGALVDGAARVILRVGSDGQVAATQLKVDPGLAPGAAEAAVLCLLAPAKMLVFPAAEGDARGLAIEAIWGQLKP